MILIYDRRIGLLLYDASNTLLERCTTPACMTEAWIKHGGRSHVVSTTLVIVVGPATVLPPCRPGSVQDAKHWTKLDMAARPNWRLVWKDGVYK